TTHPQNPRKTNQTPACRKPTNNQHNNTKTTQQPTTHPKQNHKHQKHTSHPIHTTHPTIKRNPPTTIQPTTKTIRSISHHPPQHATKHKHKHKQTDGRVPIHSIALWIGTLPSAIHAREAITSL
ncbi:hypothetical protein ACLUXI_05500, partial [Bifidobacterium apri]